MQDNTILQKSINNLDWEKSINEQEEAIQNVIQLFYQMNVDLYDLYKKIHKHSWENYCKIVEKIGYPQNHSAIPALFLLLQDLNWPGSENALLILSSIGKDILITDIEKFIKEAFNSSDFMWLGGLKILTTRIGVISDDFNDKEIFKLLDFADF